LQNSPLESSCVIVALIENYSTSKPVNVSPGKSQILSCDAVVTNEQYFRTYKKGKTLAAVFTIIYMTQRSTMAESFKEAYNPLSEKVI
jgi:hypothetical protein